VDNQSLEAPLAGRWAYAVLRIRSGHREVNYDDVAEAAEAVQTRLLTRILDRIERRLTAHSFERQHRLVRLSGAAPPRPRPQA
jgi:hypothetical protein